MVESSSNDIKIRRDHSTWYDCLCLSGWDLISSHISQDSHPPPKKRAPLDFYCLLSFFLSFFHTVIIQDGNQWGSFSLSPSLSMQKQNNISSFSFYKRQHQISISFILLLLSCHLTENISAKLSNQRGELSIPSSSLCVNCLTFWGEQFFLVAQFVIIFWGGEEPFFVSPPSITKKGFLFSQHKVVVGRSGFEGRWRRWRRSFRLFSNKKNNNKPKDMGNSSLLFIFMFSLLLLFSPYFVWIWMDS